MPYERNLAYACRGPLSVYSSSLSPVSLKPPWLALAWAVIASLAGYIFVIVQDVLSPRLPFYLSTVTKMLSDLAVHSRKARNISVIIRRHVTATEELRSKAVRW